MFFFRYYILLYVVNLIYKLLFWLWYLIFFKTSCQGFNPKITPWLYDPFHAYIYMYTILAYHIDRYRYAI